MTAYPAWTPASRPGIVPLHPYGFGTILSRSFVALRHNPKVLLGFALIVQAIAYVVLTAAVGGVAIASFARLDTVPPGSDDFNAILAGSTVITAATALVLGLATGALSVVVQGVVVSEVAHAVVSEKPRLREVWARVKPVFWRLVGYSALSALAGLIVVGVVVGIVTLLVISVIWVGVVVGILLAMVLVAGYLWLAPKLFLVPSVIILERAGVFRAVARSWRLTRGRFWSTLGVLLIISIAFGIVAQIVAIPLSLVSGLIPVLVDPTGSSGVEAFVGYLVVQLIGQLAILLVQCIALVVQSTSAALVYVDARMRVEALDHDLQTYVEQRDAGATSLPDPYLVGVGRVVERPAPAPVGSAPAYAGWGAPAYGAGAVGPQQGYGAPAQGYGAAPYGGPGQPGYGAPTQPPSGAPAQAPSGPPAPPAYGAPAPGAPAPGTPAAAPAPRDPSWAPPSTGDSPRADPPAADTPAPPAPPAPTTWAAPGSGGGE